MPAHTLYRAVRNFTLPDVRSFKKGETFEGRLNASKNLTLIVDGKATEVHPQHFVLAEYTTEETVYHGDPTTGEIEPVPCDAPCEGDCTCGAMENDDLEPVGQVIDVGISGRYGDEAALVRDEGTKGVKKDAGKPRMELIPAQPLMAVGRIFGGGGAKYDLDENGEQTFEVYRNNWRQGMRWGRVMGSLERHYNAFKAGEDFDPDTGEFHMDHVIANALMLSEYIRTFPAGDDRATPWRRMPRIGLDVDGVICSTYEAVIDAANGNLSGPFKTSMPHYAFSGVHLEAIGAFTRQQWLDLPAMIDGTDLPFEPVVYVTARYDTSLEVTEEWLMKNGFPPAPVVGSQERGKAEILKEFDVEYYVEDKYENFRKLQEEGITTFLYDQPYNRKHNVGMYRVTDLHDFAKKIGLEV